MKFNFFNVPKHRIFNYKPMYYDAGKEELQERIYKIEGKMKAENGVKKEYKFNRDKINFRKAYSEQKRAETRFPYKKILGYVAILFFVAVIYVLAKNFSFLLDPQNYSKTEKNIERQNPDWNEDSQIVIIDDDTEIP